MTKNCLNTLNNPLQLSMKMGDPIELSSLDSNSAHPVTFVCQVNDCDLLEIARKQAKMDVCTPEQAIAFNTVTLTPLNSIDASRAKRLTLTSITGDYLL